MKRVGTILLAGMLTGCITTAQQQTPITWLRQNLEERTVATAEQFSRETIRKEKHFNVERLTLPKNDNADAIIIDYYRSNAAGPRQLVLVSPILGGNHYDVEAYFLRYFATHGMDAALVHRRKLADVIDTKNLFGSMEQEMHQTITAYSRAIDSLQKEQNVRADRLCSFGISFGGIKNTLAAGADHRLRYNVIALAGSLDKIVVSDGGKKEIQNELKDLGDFETANGGKEQFLQKFNAEITTQPQRYAQGLDPSRTLLMIARYDGVVPRAASEELRKNAGFPRTIYFAGGHYSSVIYLFPFPIVQKIAKDFFKEQAKRDDREKQSVPSSPAQ